MPHKIRRIIYAAYFMLLIDWLLLAPKVKYQDKALSSLSLKRSVEIGELIWRHLEHCETTTGFRAHRSLWAQ